AGVGGYILRRLLRAALVIVLSVSVLFVLLRLTGDPVLLLLPPEASQEQVEAMREQMGFNEPLTVQYIRFLRDAAQGDFGTSLRFHVPALTLVRQRLPVSLTLIGAALGASLLAAIPAGIAAAIRRGSAFDRILVMFCS